MEGRKRQNAEVSRPWEAKRPQTESLPNNIIDGDTQSSSTDDSDPNLKKKSDSGLESTTDHHSTPRSHDDEPSDDDDDYDLPYRLFPVDEFWRKYRFKEKDSLGKGISGHVYLGDEIGNKRKVAIKLILCRIAAEREVDLHELAATDNPGVVQILDVYNKKSAGAKGHGATGDDHDLPEKTPNYQTGIVMEYFSPCTELHQFLIANPGRLGETSAIKILKELVRTVRKCHENEVYHQDIKTGNILINPTTLQTKLIDFGNSTLVREERTKRRLSGYGPPEAFDGNGCDGERSDVWCLGCVFYELLVPNRSLLWGHLKKPFDINMEVLSKYSVPCSKLIPRMLTIDEHDRITMDELILEIEKL